MRHLNIVLTQWYLAILSPSFNYYDGARTHITELTCLSSIVCQWAVGSPVQSPQEPLVQDPGFPILLLLPALLFFFQRFTSLLSCISFCPPQNWLRWRQSLQDIPFFLSFPLPHLPVNTGIFLYWFPCSWHWGADGEAQKSIEAALAQPSSQDHLLTESLESPPLGLRASFQVTDSELIVPTVPPCEFWLTLPPHPVAFQTLQVVGHQSFVLSTLPLPPLESAHLQGWSLTFLGKWQFPPPIYQMCFLYLKPFAPTLDMSNLSLFLPTCHLSWRRVFHKAPELANTWKWGAQLTPTLPNLPQALVNLGLLASNSSELTYWGYSQRRKQWSEVHVLSTHPFLVPGEDTVLVHQPLQAARTVTTLWVCFHGAGVHQRSSSWGMLKHGKGQSKHLGILPWHPHTSQCWFLLLQQVQPWVSPGPTRTATSEGSNGFMSFQLTHD